MNSLTDASLSMISPSRFRRSTEPHPIETVKYFLGAKWTFPQLNSRKLCRVTYTGYRVGIPDMLACLAMLEDQFDSQSLIEVIAQGWTPSRVAEYCNVSTREVKDFYKRHVLAITLRKEQYLAESESEEITESAEGTDEERIGNLWVSSKYRRLVKYQRVVDILLENIEEGQLDATTLREARSFMMYVATELGQIPNRGSASSNIDGDSASYEIVGVDMSALS